MTALTRGLRPRARSLALARPTGHATAPVLTPEVTA